jgi:hypothetical protein
MMSVMPNNLHQRWVNPLAVILEEVVGRKGRSKIFADCNVSDREVCSNHWRVRAVAVLLEATSAIGRDAFCRGAPDCALEITNFGKEFDFFASVNTLELLAIDREPRRLARDRHDANELKRAAWVASRDSLPVHRDAGGLAFSMAETVAEERPKIIVRHATSDTEWTI